MAWSSTARALEHRGQLGRELPTRNHPRGTNELTRPVADLRSGLNVRSDVL